MNTIKQSFAWWSFVREGVSADTVLKAAAQAGYAGVELAPEANWPAIRDSGLAIATLGGHGPLDDGMNKRSNHARIEREINARLEQAARWKVPQLICFSGNRHTETDEQGIEATADILRKVAPAARDAGVTLILELLNSAVDHAGYQCDHTAWGAAVCDRVAMPNVKLLYDIYHMQIMEGDLIRTIRNNIARIGHFHTAGNPGRHDLDDAQEIQYPAVFRAIAAAGFSGYIGHEFVPKGDPAQALSPSVNSLTVSGFSTRTPFTSPPFSSIRQ
jgi:hydroxypyruvate isomerase